MLKPLITLIAAAVFSSVTLAADTPASLNDLQTLQVVHDHWKKLPTDTHFQKWQYDMWAFSLAGCHREFGAPLPEDIKKHKPMTSGTFGMASDVRTMCEELTHGPSATCETLTTRSTPFLMPFNGLPSFYAFLSTEKAAPNGTVITVGGYCRLVAGASSTKQFYAGPATLRWLEQPSVKKFNTMNGPVALKAGTIVFEGSAPSKLPQTVIIRQ